MGVARRRELRSISLVLIMMNAATRYAILVIVLLVNIFDETKISQISAQRVTVAPRDYFSRTSRSTNSSTNSSSESQINQSPTSSSRSSNSQEESPNSQSDVSSSRRIAPRYNNFQGSISNDGEGHSHSDSRHVHDDDIGGHHCAMRFYDEFEKKAIEAKRTERRFRSQSRQRAIQERATALGKSVSEIYNSDLAASSEEDWVAIDAFEIRDVKVNYHVVIRGDREGNVSDGSLECTTRRLNLAFQNKDPTESIWNELKRQGTGACNLDVENIDKVLSDSEAFASFGEPSGISFKTNRIFRYAAICDGGPEEQEKYIKKSEPLAESAA